jgi:hypothetical protein
MAERAYPVNRAVEVHRGHRSLCAGESDRIGTMVLVSVTSRLPSMLYEELDHLILDLRAADEAERLSDAGSAADPTA